jgi:hypothetical protein
MRRKPEPLPEETKRLLAPFFPDFDLNRILICEGIPWYVTGSPRGYADRRQIYLAPGEYRPDSIEGLALLAHEIEHCRQYLRYGTWRFRARYLAAYFRNRWRRMSGLHAYLNIPFEIEAREVEAEVSQTLRRRWPRREDEL